MSDTALEVYKQRYETFRHLDKLRWQMLQLLVGVVSVAGLILRSEVCSMEGVLPLVVGIAFVLLALIMWRISEGLRANAAVLKRVGNAVGDVDLPELSSRWKSVTHWLMLTIGVSGIALCISGIKTQFQ